MVRAVACSARGPGFIPSDIQFFFSSGMRRLGTHLEPDNLKLSGVNPPVQTQEVKHACSAGD